MFDVVIKLVVVGDILQAKLDTRAGNRQIRGLDIGCGVNSNKKSCGR